MLDFQRAEERDRNDVWHDQRIEDRSRFEPVLSEAEAEALRWRLQIESEFRVWKHAHHIPRKEYDDNDSDETQWHSADAAGQQYPPLA